MSTPAPSVSANNSTTLGQPLTPGVNLTGDQFANLMRQVGLQLSNKTTSKKILTPKMGGIQAEEALTGGAPKRRLAWPKILVLLCLLQPRFALPVQKVQPT